MCFWVYYEVLLFIGGDCLGLGVVQLVGYFFVGVVQLYVVDVFLYVIGGDQFDYCDQGYYQQYFQQ